MQRDIILGIKRDLWRALDSNAESADQDFSAARLRTLQRDNYTCVFCGYKADKHQDVHHEDGNHHNNDVENLSTACKLCHACYHIGLAARDNGALMIFLPDVSQNDLNCFVRSLWVAGAIGSDAQKESADAAWQALLECRRPVEEVWGTSSPIEFANRLLDISHEHYCARENVLRPLRLLVAPNSPMVGSEVVSYWASRNPLPKAWPMITNNLYASAELQ